MVIDWSLCVRYSTKETARIRLLKDRDHVIVTSRERITDSRIKLLFIYPTTLISLIYTSPAQLLLARAVRASATADMTSGDIVTDRGGLRLYLLRMVLASIARIARSPGRRTRCTTSSCWLLPARLLSNGAVMMAGWTSWTS